MEFALLASRFGFQEAFVFPTEPFLHYKRRLEDGALHSGGSGLAFDLAMEYPWANAILTLVMAYRPYPAGAAVSGFYGASNRGFHAAGKLMKTLKEQGVRAERVYVPVRELLTRGGVGVPLKNGLTAIPGYGTRYTVQTVLLDIPDAAYTEPRELPQIPCEHCHACQTACGCGAISESGFDFRVCARAYMNGEPMESWVMEHMTTILGCELCQRACPVNREIPDDLNVPEAFDLARLLRGDVKPALEIIGVNLKKHGLLEQQACVVAARQGRKDLLPLIEPLCSDKREAVRAAARYAANQLQSNP